MFDKRWKPKVSCIFIFKDRTYLKFNESRYKQCWVTPQFPNWQNLLKIKLLFDKIQEPAPYHLEHAVRLNLSSVQKLALTKLASNHNLVTEVFIKGRDIFHMHTSSISAGLRNTYSISPYTKNLTLI